jgi:parallel beta-helix repeat protein
MKQKKQYQLHTKPILEELEPRQLFSGGLEGLIVENQLLDGGIHSDINAGNNPTSTGETDTQSNQAVATEHKELVFIDTDVENYQQLLNDILDQGDEDRNIEVILLDNQSDGIEQISETLAGYNNLDAVHLISHGSEGSVELGNTYLNTESLNQNLLAISDWAEAFSENGDFLIYGCNLAATEEGQNLVDALSQLTQTDVGASDDLTGSTLQGGDWELEYRAGSIETNIVISTELQESYQTTLTTTFQEGANGYADTQDTQLDSNNADTVQGSQITIGIDADNGAGVSQGLIKFDNIFGSGAGQIPLGATIDSASLAFNVSNASASSTINFHKMLIDWTENDTWNTTTAGVQSDNTDASSTIEATISDASATGSLIVTGLESTLQAWSNGEANYGWLIENGATDGWDFNSSDTATVNLRPKLTVTYTNNPPVANSDSTTTIVDTAVIVDLTSNDTDPENDALTVLQTDYPSNGSTVNNHDGTVTYTPDSGFTGTDNFDYLVTDISGTTHFWGLEGDYDGDDSIGSSNASVNGLTSPIVVPGVFGDALLFNESDQYVQAPDFSYNTDFTVSFQFKVADNSGSDFQYIYSHGTAGTQNSLNVLLVESGNSLNPNTFRTSFVDNDDTPVDTALDFDATSFIDNQWHTYTLTVNSTDGASIYLDGQLKSNDSSLGGDAFNPGTDLYLGARENLDAARFYGGALDSVQIFNRSLSSSEAAKTHSGGTDTATATVTVNPPDINNVPTNTQTTNEDTDLFFNSANSNLISINDPGLNSDNLQVTLTVNNGTLTLNPAMTGLSFTVGTGSAESTMTFTGSLANINAALDGMKFTPADDYNGSASLQITTYDDTSLVGAYSFDNLSNLGADDSPGTAEDGTISGAVTVNDATRGDVLSFDGTDDGVTVSGLYGEPADVTLSAWINFTGTTRGEIISLGNSVILRAGLAGDNPGLAGIFYGGTSPYKQIKVTTDLTNTGWHHVAYTMNDDTNEQRLYIDGIQVASGTTTTSIDYSKDTFTTIGKHPGDKFYFDGLIDDARIYNRALTAQEIADIMDFPPGKDSDTIDITVNAVNDTPTDLITSGALYLDGSWGGIYVPSLSLDNRTDFTVEMEINPSRIDASGWSYSLVTQHNDTNGDGERWNDNGFFLDISEAKIGYHQYDKDDTANKGQIWQGGANSSAGELKVNKWQTVTLTLDSTGKAVIYLNGIQIASTTGLPPIIDSAGTLTFLDSFEGDVREIRVFDKALNSGEVATSLTTNYDGIEADLLLLYDFEEGSGSTILDQNTPSNNGTLANPAATNWITIQSVQENSIAGTVVGFLSADDPDANDTLTYSIVSDPSNNFEIVGREVRVKTGATLDYETNIEHTITIQVTDSGGKTYNEDVTIQVSDVANTLTVTTAIDNNDSILVDGNATHTIEWLNANQGADGKISLREAIIAANNTAGADTINFDISGAGPHTINIATALPTITDQITIDGSSEPDFAANGSKPMVILDGNDIAADGLVLGSTADGSTIKGLVIRDFGGSGIQINSGSDNNTIAGNFLGAITHTGDGADITEANTGFGIRVDGSNNTIGGILDADRNVISGNTKSGIYLFNSHNNTIQGNYIGTDAAGTSDINGTTATNGQSGILIISGSTGNLIGTDADGTDDIKERNVISGNNWYGVDIIGPGTSNNTVAGNYIGTDETGLVALGNAQGGIAFWNTSTNNTIGGGSAGAGNVISGNRNGIMFGKGASTNKIQGNFIGIGADGSTSVGNTDGIYLYNGNSTALVTGNIIGTDGDGTNDANEGNVISANTNGIVMEDAEVTGNIIAGNYIGTDATGTLDKGNTGHGITITNSGSHTIGGNGPNEGNIISGNDGSAILIGGGGADNINIQGNLIGTQVDGTSALGNSEHGILFSNTPKNATIGGINTNDANTIAYNGLTGVTVLSGSTGISIIGNSIHSNTGIGVDLSNSSISPDGVSTNDSDDSDTGGNNRQNFPVLTAAVINGGQITINGTVTSTANTHLRIEFFANTSGDSSGYGEGERYLGFVNVTTDDNGDGSGDFTFSKTITAAIASGEFITATATVSNAAFDSLSDTSEFAQSLIANTPPILNLTPGGGTYYEADPQFSTYIDTGAIITDVDSGDYEGGQITTTIITNGTTNDRLLVKHEGNGAGEVEVVGGSIYIDSNLVATTTGGTGASNPLVITFTSNADVTIAQKIARRITFKNISDTPSENQRTIEMVVTDGDLGTSNTDTRAMNIVDVNDAPTFFNLDGNPTFTENGSPVVLDADVSIFDAELSNADNFDGATLTLTRNGGSSVNDVFSSTGLLSALTVGNLDYSGTIIGTVTSNSAGTLVLTFNNNATNQLVTDTMRSIAYSNSSDAPAAPVQIDWTFDDGNTTAVQGNGGALSVTGNTIINIDTVNDAPVIDGTGTMTLASITEDDTNNNGNTVAQIIASAGGDKITDADAGALEGIAVIAANGGNGTWEYSVDDGTSWIAVGVVDNSSALLLRDIDRLRLVPNGDTGTNANVGFRAWDQTNGTEGTKLSASPVGGTSAFSSITESAQISVTNINDVPVATGNTVIADEDVPLVIGAADFSFTDIESDSLASVTITGLTLNGGTLTHSVGSVAVTNGMTITVAQLADLTFTSASNDSSNSSFTYTVNDAGTGVTSAVMNITVNAVNDAPKISGVGSVFINELHYDNISTDTGEAIELAGKAGTDLSGWNLVLYNGSTNSVYNTKALSGVFTNQSDGYGTLVFNYPVNGLQNGDPDGIALVDNTGTVVQFISYEGTITADGGPADGMTSTDIGVAENNSTPIGDSLQLTGTGPNYTWSAPATSTFGSMNSGQSFESLSGHESVAEDTPLLFSTANNNALTISDVDADVGSPDPLSVTLTVTNGVLTLGTTSGLANLAGNITNTITFEGSVVEVNAALEGLKYQGNQNYFGSDTLTITVDDQGNIGSGGAMNTTGTIAISVTSVNDAPTVANAIPNQTATEDAAFSVQFASNTFADIDVGDTLTYTSDASGWLGFNAATRTFSGTPANGDVGTTTVTVTANDGNGGIITDTFDIVVSNTNDAPTVANLIPDQAATEDSVFTFTFVANTFNDSDVGDVLTYTSDATGWLSFDAATRTFTGTPLNANVGTTTVTVTADDGNGGIITDTFDIVISNTNDAPTVANLIPNQTATEDTAFSVQFASNTFADIDVGDTLTYTSDATGWLAFNAGTRTFTGTPLNANVGTTTVTVTADDGNGGIITDTFDIIISNTNDAPTVANLIPDQAATEDSAFSFQFASNTFADVDVGDALTYTSDESGWLGFNAATRTFSGTPLNANVGTTTVTVTADDGNGGIITDTFDIVISNTNDAPTVANLIPDQAATEDSVFTFTFAANTFNDSDVGDTLTYTSDAAGWLAFNAGTRTFTGTPLNGDVGTTTVTVTADDGNGGIITDTFDIVISNTNDAPTTSLVTLNPITEDSGTRIITQLQLLVNANDVDGNTLTATGLMISSGTGSLVDNNDGTWTYTSALNDDTSVSFSYTITDGTDTTAGSATLDITPIDDPPAGLPSITGIAIQDQILTANTTNIYDEDGLGTFSYQWLRDGVSIEGATSLTYTLGDADVGTKISVRVSYTDGKGIHESVTSLQTLTVTDNLFGIIPEDGNEVDDRNIIQSTVKISVSSPIDSSVKQNNAENPLQGNNDNSLPELSEYFIYEEDEGLYERAQYESKKYTPFVPQSFASFLKYIHSIDMGPAPDLNGLAMGDDASVSDDLWKNIELMRSQIDLSDKAGRADSFKVEYVAGASISFTAGIVSWVLRGGSLMASFLSSVPVFRNFDPLPIATSKQKASDDKKNNDDNEQSPQKTASSVFDDS